MPYIGPFSEYLQLKIGPITFKKFNLKHADAVIFDAMGSENVNDLFLSGISHQVLPVRNEFYYASFNLIVDMVAWIAWLLWLKTTAKLQISLRQVLNQAYYAAFLDQVRPKLVLTWIDNDPRFHTLSEIYNAATFIAFENGARWHLVETMHKYTVPHYVCYGDYERKAYTMHGHRVGQTYAMGSMLGSFAKQKFADVRDEIYDLCFVSQWRDAIMLGGAQPERGRAGIILYEYLDRYVRETKRKLCVACASTSAPELDYCRKLFDDSVTILPIVRAERLTYKAMLQSNLMVTVWSTAAVEAFGWGKKTLMCNFASDKTITFFERGIWMMDSGSYEDFRDRLNELLAMPVETFQYKAKDAIRLAMKYPKGQRANYEIVNAGLRRVIASEKVYSRNDRITFFDEE